MKKTIFALITGVAIMISGSHASAQGSSTGDDFRFTVKTNPLSILGGPIYALWIVPLTNEYKLSFEAQTFGKQSVQVGVGYLGTSPLISTIMDMSDADSDTTLKSGGFHGQLWYKFFLTDDDAPSGFYVGPHVSYAWAKMKNSADDNEYITAAKLNIHLALGYQIISKGGFALDIFTGVGIKNKSYDSPGMEMDEFLDDLNLTNKFTVSVPLGLTFGYAF
ncbi:MAG: hypothetical protein JXR66_03560 [Bacteroidales bacterium]|nr:hypothetical protein [Bacteroidales bacterium]MBN2632607.1 hypothetical protein [Bacteroidales bacterium]